MAKIKPFCAVRPVSDKVHLVSTRSYITYGKKELQLKLENNPYSFLNVIHPFSRETSKIKRQSKEYLNAIKNKFLSFLDAKILLTDKKAGFYIYTQKEGDKFYTGIIALAAVDDYLNNVIKKHEATLTHKEERLKNYLSVVDINAEPVCITYEDNSEINDIIAAQQKQKPIYKFATPDKTEHWLWAINDDAIIVEIENAFGKISSLYIADGHHRAASSSRYALEQRKKDKNYSGNEPYNYFMSIFFSEKQIVIHDFNRVVKDLNGLSDDDFISQLKEDFDIKILPVAEKPQDFGQINMYLGRKWYNLKAKAHCFVKNSVSKNIDSYILTEKILTKRLAIEDIRTDKRIQFVNGVAGIDNLAQLVDCKKYTVAFALHPVSIEQLEAIADNNEIMPPKTTWIHPKLRSALTIYRL